jgi:hypothetical protein
MGRVRAARGLAAALALLVGAAACSGGGRSQSAFCSKLGKDQVVVASVADADGVRAAVSQYEALDKVAPLAISDEWHQLTELVKRAATVDPKNTDGSSALVAQAFASSSAAQKVLTYARTTCHVNLSSPTTAPHP